MIQFHVEQIPPRKTKFQRNQTAKQTKRNEEKKKKRKNRKTERNTATPQKKTKNIHVFEISGRHESDDVIL